MPLTRSGAVFLAVECLSIKRSWDDDDCMDPLECVDRIVRIIGDADRVVGRGQAASEASLAAAEGKMGLRFPPSYRAFLAAVGPMRISYGQTGKASLLVYGLNGDRAGLPNVEWLYGLGRTPAARRHLGIATTYGKTWPFSGLEFALDMALLDPTTGEPPVVASEVRPTYGEPLARDFGSWLLALLEALIPQSAAMGDERLRCPIHSTTTKEYGQPGPRVFFGECTCGWRSDLKPEIESLKDVARHVAHPEEMREEPYWR